MTGDLADSETALRSELAAVQAAATAATQNFTVECIRVAELDSAVTELCEQNDAAGMMVSELETSLDVAKARLAAANKETADAVQKIATETSRATDLESAIAELREKNDAAGTMVLELEPEKLASEGKLAGIVSESETLRATRAEHEDAANAQSRVAQLYTELEAGGEAAAAGAAACVSM